MALREVTWLAVILRIIVSFVLGGMLGMERGLKQRPAGLRTYMLVCVGACLIMMTNQYIYQATGTGDPTRMSAQVISGIGFLGAGTIVVTQHNQIKGLTTAAGLWACAAVGLALGIGFYEAALISGTAIYVILTLLQRWDDKLKGKTKIIELYIEMAESVALGELIVLLVFGTGTIRGFGMTLGLSVLVSMFTAVFVTRILLKNLVAAHRWKPAAFTSGEIKEEEVE